MNRLFLIVLLFSIPVFAQRPGLEERISILEESIENRKLEGAVKVYKSVNGMGPAASGVYNVDSGFSFGGYGEIKYRNYDTPYLTDVVDVHRFILYTGYKFNDWIVLNAEIEYEHAGFETKKVVTDVDFGSDKAQKSSVNSGDVFVEFAYLDFSFAEWLQLSAGLNLMPIGITNYMHEPTTFNPVERPLTETYIIPSTWREIGAIFHGRLFDGRLVYRVGIVTGLNGEGFSDSGFIRGGRQKGSNAKADTPAYILNMDYKPFDGLLAGGSFYRGRVDHGDMTSAGNREIQGSVAAPWDNYFAVENDMADSEKVWINIAEAHYDWKVGDFYTRGLVARSWMNENAARAVNKSTGKNVGMVAEGGYIEAGYNILGLTRSSKKLFLFVRNEMINTQKETVRRYAGGKEDIADFICSAMLANTCNTTDTLGGGNQDLGVIENSDSNKEAYGVNGLGERGNDRRVVTVGMAFLPHPNVTLKLDYEKHYSKTDYFLDSVRFNDKSNRNDRVNFAVGYIF